MDKRLFGLILAMFILLGVSYVLGANNVTTMIPANGTTINGSTYNFSATLDAVGNISNVTFWWSTNFTSWLAINDYLNTTTSGTIYSVIFNTSQLGDDTLDNEDILINATTYTTGAGTVAYHSNVTHIDVDNTDPTVTLNGPASNVWNKSSSIRFEFTPSDVHFDTCILDIAGSENSSNRTTAVANGSLNLHILNVYDATSYLWNVFCNDTVGHFVRTANRTLKVDATKPRPELTMPSVTVIGAQRLIKIKCKGNDDTSNVYSVSANIKNPKGKTFTQTYVGNEKTFEFRGTDTGYTGRYEVWCTAEDQTKYNNPRGNWKDTSIKEFTVLARVGKGKAVPVEEAPEEEVEEGVEKEEDEGAAMLPEEIAGKAGLWITLIVVLAIIVIIYFAVKGKKKKY